MHLIFSVLALNDLNNYMQMLAGWENDLSTPSMTGFATLPEWWFTWPAYAGIILLVLWAIYPLFRRMRSKMANEQRLYQPNKEPRAERSDIEYIG
jgi:hypothetical protein